MNNTFLILICVFLVACAGPKYTSQSLNMPPESVHIDIVEDEDTRDGFKNTMINWLNDNGYSYSVIPEGSNYDLNNLTIEYVGHWGWDLALYLKNAKLDAFWKGQRAGEVEFRVPYTANLNKFGSAEERISYSMDILFGKISADDATRKVNNPDNTESKRKRR